MILADLGLTPVILIGAMDSDTTSNKFQSQRLHSALDGVGVRSTKLNMATYGLVGEIKGMCKKSRIPILELTNRTGAPNLEKLIEKIKPAKVIFLQPSGGISRRGKRITVMNTADSKTFDGLDLLTEGQERFLTKAKALLAKKAVLSVFVMASPLNLLAELFTTKGSGTMIRRGATIKTVKKLSQLDKKKLQTSMESAFDKSLRADFLKSKITAGYVEENYRAGAVFTQLADLPYLSKFWVVKEARGEGIARDIWDIALAKTPAFFWRSRMDNPFNDWYMARCDGMQIAGNWRVFWKGLSAHEVAEAITVAASSAEDFSAEGF